MQDRPEKTENGCFDESLPDVQEVTFKLLDYCLTHDWAGYDPYDALNSKLFAALPFSHTRIARLAFTQAMKRSPVNLRRVLMVQKTQNPKGLALFLIALLKLRKLTLLHDDTLLSGLLSQIIGLRSPDTGYWCWGYSFPWQTRTFLVPRGAPNLVCTTFVANAFLDAFEALGDTRYLAIAISAGEYLVRELYYTESDSVASFSYPIPGSKSKIHNANFLAAALLGRLYHHTRNDELLHPALDAARYSAGKQKDDGSWSYGESTHQVWIDNFHTGYNLTSLRLLDRNLSTSEFGSRVRRGFAFYRDHFFRDDGAVRYFHNKTYPIDIHCVAQSLLTLLEFQDLDPTNSSLARLVYSWATKHMWDERGFFYYRVLQTLTIRTSYMRWSQAWMLLALTKFLELLKQVQVPARVTSPQEFVA